MISRAISEPDIVELGGPCMVLHDTEMRVKTRTTVFPPPSFLLFSFLLSHHYLRNNSYFAWRIGPTFAINLFLSFSPPSAGWGGGNAECGSCQVIIMGSQSHLHDWDWCCHRRGGVTPTGSQGNSNIPLDLAVKLYLWLLIDTIRG